ncbi:heme A synthase [Anaerolineales bacterium]
MQYTRFRRYAWIVIFYNIGVILWGAIVRATGSGAGCGNHWPTCNGDIIPQPEAIETMIEFAHRLTSGFSGILVIILLIWAFKLYPPHRFVRINAILSFLFILIEGGLGALLVRLELVADNTSASRAVVIGLHLINTLVLLLFLTLVAWGASKQAEEIHKRISTKHIFLMTVSLILTALLSAFGAVTALGDTLFPAESLMAGFKADLDSTAHFMIQLRVIHPILALLTAFYLFYLGAYIRRKFTQSNVQKLWRNIFFIILLQLSIGFINVIFLAPIWVQLIHLALADILWIALVVVFAEMWITNPSTLEIKAD